MKQTYETGLAGEKAAENWLHDQLHMVCLERRFRSKAGEIDLIMLDDDTVVFVEVKTRKNSMPGSGLAAVDRRKQQRIARAASLYLVHTGRLNQACRFDVIEVRDGEVFHIPNAFQYSSVFFH